MKISIIVITSLAVLLNKAAIGAAQSAPPAGVTVPSTPPVDQTIPTPSQSPNFPPATPSPTPSPSLETPPTPAPSEPPVPSGEGVLIKKIEIVGNPTVLQREIAELVKKYEGKEVTFEDLLNLRARCLVR